MKSTTHTLDHTRAGQPRRARKFWALLATIGAVTAASLGAGGTASAYPAPYGASGQALYQVVNADGGVYWRSGPHSAQYQAIAGYGVYTGDPVDLDCWAYGDPVGPYGDRLWYYSEMWYSSAHYNVNNPYGDDAGWVNDHYLNTPGTAANPQPIGPECSGY